MRACVLQEAGGDNAEKLAKEVVNMRLWVENPTSQSTGSREKTISFVHV
jgi:hypothetical protein